MANHLNSAPGDEGLLRRMVETRQLSPPDADTLTRLRAERGGGFSTETEVLAWLAEEYGLEYSSLEDSEPDARLLAKFPAKLLLQEEILPLSQQGDTVRVATSKLFADHALQGLQALTGFRLEPILAPSEVLQREIKRRLGVGADTLQTLEEDASFQWVQPEQDEQRADLDKGAEDASIIRFVNQVLSDAISLRATDVHIEPFEEQLRIRYRIDGLLQEVPVPPRIKRFQPAIVSRVKILSGLNIAEKRLPQDGRIKIRQRDSEVDVRISVIPMIHGEAVVLRLLRRDARLMRLDDLGMGERDRQAFEHVLQMPHGIVLITGPTGSGKTTTLYSALNEINDAGRKIITVEDPVEYQLMGVNQIQVSEKTGLTFARGLRAILRHDPDVILIGEIRDHESAEIAVQASLTGHLVFSTLHTNDAPGALVRLVDMGVEPYLVASSLEAVMAQRLVRVLCPACRRPDDSEKSRVLCERFPALRSTVPYRSTGCSSCRQTGYFGRRALFETMLMSAETRRLLLAQASSSQVRTAARREGMHTLLEDGWRLVQAGITSLDEVLRVSKDERLHAEEEADAGGRIEQEDLPAS